MMNLNIKGNIYTNQNSTVAASVLQAKQNEAAQSSFVNALISEEERHYNQRIKPAEELAKKREYNEEDERRQQKERERDQSNQRQALKQKQEQQQKNDNDVVATNSSAHIDILA